MRLKAFTLVETILYLGLFNVIFFAVITLTISLSQNNSASEYKNAIEKNTMFVTEHLTDTFSKGLTVDSANSTFATNLGKVRVTSATGYMQYTVSNGKLTVTNGTNTYELTDKFVNVTMFQVDPVIVLPNTIVGAKIKVTFVSQKYPNLNKTIESYYAFR